MYKLVFFIGLAVFTTGGSSRIQAASFDCGRASTPTEHAICDYSELSALDELMGAAYQSARQSPPGWMTEDELRQSQREWIASRDRCGSNYLCIREEYTSRLKEISASFLEFNTGSSFASYLYQGDPASGKCPQGTVLAEWGQCVTAYPGGPRIRGFSVGGSMAFDVYYDGPNGHSCSLAGRAERQGSSWIYRDNNTSCELLIEISADGFSIFPQGNCNNYCGMRAQGGLEQYIEY